MDGLTFLLPDFIWSIASAIVCAVAAWMLKHWSAELSARRRTLFATTTALASSFVISAWISLPTGGWILLSMAPDEFLVPFFIQIGMVLVISVPVAWLVSLPKSPAQSLADVFD